MSAEPTATRTQHCVDLALGAVPSEAWLGEEAGEAIQGLSHYFRFHLKHVTGEVAGSIGVGLSTVLLHKLMVLTFLRILGRAREEHVLQEMCQARQIFPLVAHAHIDAKPRTGLVTLWIRTDDGFEAVVEL